MRERTRAVAFVLVWTVALASLLVAIRALQPSDARTDEVSASLRVEGPSWTISYDAETPNGTAFGLLAEASDALGFDLRWVEYGWPYEDVFVTSINGTRNDGGQDRWWQYCVNGEYAAVGASHYALNEGDRVLWRYAAPGGDGLCD